MIRIQGYFGEAPTTSGVFEITPAGGPEIPPTDGVGIQGGCSSTQGSRSSTPIPWCAVGLVLVWMMNVARRHSDP
jgi:hypothetical protein